MLRIICRIGDFDVSTRIVLPGIYIFRIERDKGNVWFEVDDEHANRFGSEANDYSQFVGCSQTDVFFLNDNTKLAILGNTEIMNKFYHFSHEKIKSS